MVPLRAVPVRHRRECFQQLLRERDHLMKNVDGPAVRLVDAGDEMLASVLPETLAVQLGGIAEACPDGLMAVEAAALCGGWNARDPRRSHERGGTTPASVVMGGQLLPIRRPRVHAVEDGERAGEVPLATYGIFAQGDVLTRVAIERMMAGGDLVRCVTARRISRSVPAGGTCPSWRWCAGSMLLCLSTGDPAVLADQ